MPQDAPESGIQDWEKSFWTLHGLLGKMQPKKKDDSPKDDSYLDSQVKAANDSFRKAAEAKQGTTMKTSASYGKRAKTRKPRQRKTGSGK